MKEDFLHYVWRHQLFSKTNLQSTEFNQIEIVFPGMYNTNSGPDFLNAKIKIEDILWAGNVEIHVKSSDWYVHQHEKDANYDSVILHVVWEDDAEVFSKDNLSLPTINLSKLVAKDLLFNYQKLYSKEQRWIPCESTINTIDSFVFENWKERLFFERLEEKSVLINQLLNDSNSDYEAVLFKLLTKNFGLKTNGEAFLNLANSIDFSIVRKLQNDSFKLQALFFGQAGFLKTKSEEQYAIDLKTEYEYLKYKFKLEPIHNGQFQFFRMRPTNFPTIRIAQLVSLYQKHQNLFSKLMEIADVKEMYKFFSIDLNDFWKTHYTFQKTGLKSAKNSTKSFVDLLLINSVIPLKFNYLKSRGEVEEAEFLTLIQQLKPEQNSIISKFKEFGILSKNAFETQALLQLKKNYCAKKRCLQCAIGNVILNRI
ncbi:hypothetical protein KCTC32516_01599 [Polaribacter huanghezhanensis]|uniref:DUF2851 family protein n=1 Tax=Polaribacter huanghezhanensis TaxID=1354726 RepID=UPI002649275B|nr:DUF2851 family protein [Polaribacter huanghezhanensis]WKD86238.1 hypothetical protein KCTC32516_01599 [Polaribacter huanghezhanensis]